MVDIEKGIFILDDGSSLSPKGFRVLGIKTVYTTGQYNLSQDFFVPLLSHAITYDRGVGYFSSGWLRVNAFGLAKLAERGGKARWVTSPILSKEDIEVFTNISKQEQNSFLTNVLLRTVDDIEQALEQNTLNTMAWMIEDDLLEFKFAIPSCQLDGDFHDKFGVFRDSFGQRVSFLGSYNDTVKGLSNYESIRVFCSWIPVNYEGIVEDEARFSRIWSNSEPNLNIFNMPDAVRRGLLCLRNSDRPYNRTNIEIDTTHVSYGFVPREYQNIAIDKWKQNGYCGILDMATGTGKTMVALMAINICPSPGYIIIGAPTSVLVKQWLKTLEKVKNIRMPIEISSDNHDWLESLILRLRVVSSLDGIDKPFVFVGTYASLTGDRFLSAMKNVSIIHGMGLLIADEVHNLGAKKMRKLLVPQFSYRLGLTATLERAYDEEGTEYLDKYFNGVVYKLSIDQVVGSVLCDYQYDIFFGELSDEEYEEYIILSRQIAVMMDRKLIKSGTIDKSKQITTLLNKRANIVKGANNKFKVLGKILEENKLRKALIYCADLDQLEGVRSILDHHKILNLKFTGEENNYQRKVALEQLERGDIQVIVAIKCLDEGVDMPQVYQAILLASSTSEREFVQRRGRILRRAPGKQRAHLIDIFSVPPMQYYKEPPNMLFSELKRARILARAALNCHEADLKLVNTLQSYGVPIEQVLS